jgi:hypothetical protein
MEIGLMVMTNNKLEDVLSPEEMARIDEINKLYRERLPPKSARSDQENMTGRSFLTRSLHNKKYLNNNRKVNKKKETKGVRDSKG